MEGGAGAIAAIVGAAAAVAVALLPGRLWRRTLGDVDPHVITLARIGLVVSALVAASAVVVINVVPVR